MLKRIFLDMKGSSSFNSRMMVYLNIKSINLLFQTNLKQLQVQVKEQTWTNWHKGKHRPPKVIAGSSLFVANTSIGGVIDRSGGTGQTTRREHSPAHAQTIGLKIYWAWPHPSEQDPEQDPVSPTVSLPHQEASISLLSLSLRGQREWKPQPQKTNQAVHMDHNLV